MDGSRKPDELGPWASAQLKMLEEDRNKKAALLYKLLDPKLKLGRYSPHYLPAILDLYAIEMRLDGFRVGLDLEATV